MGMTYEELGYKGKDIGENFNGLLNKGIASPSLNKRDTYKSTVNLLYS